jgi:hypothetical protein
MRALSTCIAAVSGLVIVAACLPPKNQNDPANPQASATATYQAYPPAGQYPPGQYPQQQAYPNGYPPPQGTYAQPYPTAPPPTAPTAAPPPTAAPGGGGQMAVPGQLAFQCQNDVPCGTHHCNTQYGKCAFPCQSATDCIAPNQCIAGLCAPALPQQQPH